MSEDLHTEISQSEHDEQLSRRRFLITAGLAAGFTAAGLPASAGHLSGTWNVEIEWNGRTPKSVLWTLRGNGTFYSNDGYSGVWVQSGDLVLLTVKSESRPAFAGTLSGAVIPWGVALQANGDKGTWTARQRP